MDPEQLIAIGRLVRPWGLEGALVVELHTDDVARFEQLDGLWVDGPSGLRAARKLRWRKLQDGRPLVWLDLATSRSEAEQWVGAWLKVEPEQAVAPAPHSYFRHQLRGLEVRDPAGRRLGRLRDVQEAPAHDLWEVETEDGRVFLVPAVRAFIKQVDVDAGYLVAELPAGLVELNQGGSG